LKQTIISKNPKDEEKENEIIIRLNPTLNEIGQKIDLVIFTVNLTNFFKKEEFEKDLELYRKIIEENYFCEMNKTPILLIFTMWDKFQESFIYHDFQKYFEDYEFEDSPIIYIKNQFLKIYKERVTVFVTCGFDFERNYLLYELIEDIKNGYEIFDFYPYKGFFKQPTISFKLSDINFKFKFK